MKSMRKLGWAALLAVGGLGLSAGALACELGSAEVNQHGAAVHYVSDSAGARVGQVSQRSDGQWEAVVHGQGALNEGFTSAARAAEAVCANSR
ncbi:MAG: hypothetical protein JJT90_16720 [Ectothiorhodospiraceae bacterium]|nr:hypothetical protein [Ectothiorhodospiraceae bacterium]